MLMHGVAGCGVYMSGLIVVLVCAVSGCGRLREEPIELNAVALQRMSAERCRIFQSVVGPRTVELTVNVEYPARTGLTEAEYRELTGFITQTLGSGTNFENSVDSLAHDLFTVVGPLMTNENLKADAELGLNVTGEMEYSDERFLSCDMSMRGVCSTDVKAVYDRKLRKTLTVSDFVSSNDFPKLRMLIRKRLRDYGFGAEAEGLLKDPPADWPAISENFGVDTVGMTWVYGNGELGVGGGVKLIVLWEDLKPLLRDSSMVPTGRNQFVSDGAVVRQNDGDDWWKLPFSRVKLYETAPPDPPWSGTNYPYADFQVKLKKPVQGNMSDERYLPLLNFIGSAITHGKGLHRTIDEAIHTERVIFWDGVIQDAKKSGLDSGHGGPWDVFEMVGEVRYQTENYFCYMVSHQHGCPCCVCETNIVWNWETMAPVKINDVVNTGKFAKELKMLMRAAVYEDLKKDYSDNMALVLPDYAKNWPYTFENFYLTGKGITWSYDAGEVLIGGKGHMETTLSWESLMPYLTDAFAIPPR